MKFKKYSKFKKRQTFKKFAFVRSFYEIVDFFSLDMCSKPIDFAQIEVAHDIRKAKFARGC